MTARTQWRYIAWTRAEHRGERVRAAVLRFANDLDRDNNGPPSRLVRILDALGDWPPPEGSSR